MSENDSNVKNVQGLLFNYLINYLTRNRNKNRSNLVTRIDRQIYEDFIDVCRRLGLLSQRGRVNITLEGLMQLMIEKFKDSPKIVQTTLFYKPTINVSQKVEVSIAQKLELKLVKKDLSLVLMALEKKQGNRRFYESRLKEVLPKAIRTYEKTADEEVRDLLHKAEKWI